MSKSLMRSRRFAPLFWTQFLSAFNDNFLKNALVFLILFTLAASEAAPLVTLAGAVFMAPFLFLSALGGELADRFDKAMMARRLKLAEIGGAALAVLGIALSSVPVLMAALAYFGVVSALFGPIKYGILPDHLDESELPGANAWIEGATFAAILAGTIAGGVVSANGVSAAVFGPLMMVTAVACWAISRYIPETGSAAPDLIIDRNILRSTWRLAAELRGDTRIWRAALMVSWFWVIGALLLAVMPTLVKDWLGGDEMAVTVYLTIFAISIGIGSALAAWMSQGRIVLLPAPVGTGLVALFGLDLALSVSGMSLDGVRTRDLATFFAGDNAIRIAVDFAGMAIAGAFLVVPSFAAVQAWAPKDRRARVVAGVNVLSAGFMTLGGAFVALVQAQNVSILTILYGMAAANAVAAWLMLRFLPTSAFRDLVSILFRAFLRLEVKGLENVKAAGKAPILALNHVSFLDGPLALTLTDEEPVFAIDHGIARLWWVRPFLKLARALPLDPARPMATRTLIKAVQGGDPLVIFPEGRITVTGGLMKVYDGAAMVADKTGSMVVPIRIEGLEKSFFSRLTAMHVRKSLFPKVKVTILEPVRLNVPEELKGRKRRIAAGAELYQVMSDLLFRTADIDNTVLKRIIATASERGMGELAIEDPLTGSMNYRKLLSGAAVLGEKFKALFPAEETLGVMLPNGNGTCATVLGVMSAGKVAAMLNFTAGTTNLLAACKAAEIKTLLTSRVFVEQAKLGAVIDGIAEQVDIVWLDDLRPTIGLWDKALGFIRRSKPLVSRSASDPAVILFTSGSEGTPKGVVLTHRNILANVAQAAARIDFNASDKVFNVLPVFHSFGLTAGTVLPLIAGVPVYFYPTPLHYRIIPELVYASNATIMFGTDTFLNGYARTAHPYDFRSLRYCFAGAEPVKAPTRTVYMEKFGVRILEGYGATETAPVISINTPMYNKAGTVGKILPGIDTRLEPVPGVDDGGRLHVRGANVMAGYLRAENPGEIEPLPGGWYDTGDIVSIDEDGFVAIKGRAKRFAKVGGEMVSLAAVEALAAEIWRDNLSAVVAVPDQRKGEKLILITEAAEASRSEFLAFAKSNGAMDLMVPAEVRVVENVPVLGSGKIDFAGVAKLVGEESG